MCVKREGIYYLKNKGIWNNLLIDYVLQGWATFVAVCSQF